MHRQPAPFNPLLLGGKGHPLLLQVSNRTPSLSMNLNRMHAVVKKKSVKYVKKIATKHEWGSTESAECL